MAAARALQSGPRHSTIAAENAAEENDMSDSIVPVPEEWRARAFRETPDAGRTPPTQVWASSYMRGPWMHTDSAVALT